MSSATEAKAVLADLYEEETGDTEKRWPPEWMAVKLAASERGELARHLALEAGANADLIDEAITAASLPGRRLPVYFPLYTTDSSQLNVDLSGQYDPQLEVIQEVFDRDEEPQFELYRFDLDRFKLVAGMLVPFEYQTDWPHPVESYNEWFERDLEHAARSAGISQEELVEALCSASPWERAFAYDVLSGYHGLNNFDNYPIRLTEEKLDARWSR